MATLTAPPYPPARPLNWSRDAVQKSAEGVAEAVHYKPGDDLRSVVEFLGGTLHYQDAADLAVSYIDVHGPFKFDIFLSPFASRRRDRFTIAHEIGHFVLHSDLGKVQLTASRENSNRAEWEANWFAANFLMPEKIFREKSAEGLSNAQLADCFDVSEAAIEVRKSSLGIEK